MDSINSHYQLIQDPNEIKIIKSFNSHRLNSLILFNINSFIEDMKLDKHRLSTMNYLPIIQLIDFIINKISKSTDSLDHLQIIKNLRSQISLDNQTSKTALKVSVTTTNILEKTEFGFLSTFELALKSCRKSNQLNSEYLLRMLFVNFVLLDTDSSNEAIHKSLEFERDHLDTYKIFDDIPGSHQEKYDHHFNNYLNLLIKLFDLKILENEMIENKLPIIMSKLKTEVVLSQLSVSDFILLQRSIAYLLTRPEWFFQQNKAEARFHLIHIKTIAVDTIYKEKIDLDLIALEVEQVISGNKTSRKALISLLNQIIALNNISPLGRVKLMFLGAKIYERLIKISDNIENQFQKFKKTLEVAIEIGEKNMELFDFGTLHQLAYCRFLLGFYNSFAFEDIREFALARKHIIYACGDFWLDKKTTSAAAFLKECLSGDEVQASFNKIDKKKFVFLYMLKLILLKEIYHFGLDYIAYSDSSINLQIENIDIQTFLQNESRIWDDCKNSFASNFIKGNIQKVEYIIKNFFVFYYLNAEQEFNEYCKVLPRFQSSKMIWHNPKEFSYSLFTNRAKIENFFSKAVEVPLMEYFLTAEEGNYLEGECQFKFEISGENVKEEIIDESLETNIKMFYDIFSHVCEVLENREGDLQYANITNNVIMSYVNSIIESVFLNEVFATSLSDPTKRHSKAIVEFRHHVDSILKCCDLSILAYKWSGFFLSEPDREDYQDVFERALLSTTIGQMVSQLPQEKLDWCEKRISVNVQRHTNLIGRVPNNSLENSFIELLYSEVIRINCYGSEENKIIELEIFFSSLPDVYEEIEEVLLSSQFHDRPNEIIEDFITICLYKAQYLIYTQKIEKGIRLFNELQNKFFSKLNLKVSAEKFNLKIEIKSSLINPKKLKWMSKNLVKKINKEYPNKSSQDISKNFNISDTSSKTFTEDKETSNIQLTHKSVKNEVLTTLKEKMYRRQIKHEKKMSKTTLVSSHSTDVPTSQLTGIANHSIKFIKKKDMEIFNLFWMEKNVSEQILWKNRSFRNDFNVSRKKVLQLIHALGGTYEPSRGHGSHHVAHLPKIEFNGIDVGGLVDYETGELMITLTNEAFLKYYQIIQLRNILIQQGFTPESVKENND